MTEAAFPVLGAAFVVLIVLPASAVLAKLGLLLIERIGARGPLDSLNLRYVLLTGSSFLPLVWFLSAGVHQAETGQSALSCLLKHEQGGLCFEPASFAMLLAAIAGLAALRSLRRSGRVSVASSPAALDLADRIEKLVDATGSLRGVRGRVVVTEESGFTIGTRGVLSPTVFISVAFAAKLTDSMLCSALGHEQEHVRTLDPLRYLLLHFALLVNPCGRYFLASHAARWKAARETYCDREAVIHGASPLPLADAIVRAARPTLREAAALGARDTAVLELRIKMLLAFAECAPKRLRTESRSAIPVALMLLVMTVLLPHQTGTGALDALHSGAEHALTYVWR